MEKDPVKQIRKYQKQRVKCQEKGNLKEEAEILNVLGELYTELGDHEESLTLHKEELGLCQVSEDKIGQAVAHRKIGECFAALENYTKALQHQHRHLELAKVAGDQPEQQRAYTTIGRTYLIQGEDLHNAGSFEEARPLFKKAETSFQSSLRLSQSIQESKTLSEKEVHQMKTRSITNLALAYHYISLEKYEKNDGIYAKQSLALFQKALNISQKYMLAAESHQTNILLTSYYRNRLQPDLAIRYAEDACRNAKVARNIQWQIEALNVLGEIHLSTGNCKSSKKSLKKSFRLINSSEEKTEVREKLKSVVKINHLQSKIEDSLTTADEKFKLHDIVADKFCDLGCYQAAIGHYKQQELLFPLLDTVTDKQKASVYYSLALTNSDLNNYETAIEYYKKEMEFYTEPNELCKTWTQIGICLEKLSKPPDKIENCYNKAIQYAEKSENCKLQLKVLNLQLDIQVKSNLPSADETRKEISKIQMKSGILVLDNEEDSEDICGKGSGEAAAQEEIQNETSFDIRDEDSEDLLEKELENVSSDNSDTEETRKSRITSKVWKRKLNEKGETPLHRACIDGHMKRVQLLLEQGHPVNEPDYAGWLPLHEACNHGFVEIVRLLINHGANVNYPAKCGGTTPMQDAATNGHLDIVALLLEKGANPSIKNKEGETPINALESWFSRSRSQLDSYDIESYRKIHENLLKAATSGGHKENTGPSSDLNVAFGNMDDLFDSEISSQKTIEAGGGLTQTYNRGIPKNIFTPYSENSTKPSQNSAYVHEVEDLPNFSQKIDDFGDLDPKYDENDSNFSDSQILPTLESRTRISKVRQSQGGDKDSFFDSAGEYQQAMNSLGGSEALARLSNGVKSFRAPKRPSTDGFDLVKQGLVGEDDYMGDDWLIDDTDDVGSNPSLATQMRPPKRPKTVHSTNTGQTNFGTYGWKQSNSVKKSLKDTNSAGFSSSFLNRSSIRNKTQPKKLITTKIKDFMPEPLIYDDITIEDDDVMRIPSVPNGIPSVSSTSFFTPNPPTTQPITTQPPQTMRVKVKINGKMFLIAVPGSTKTISWLCERAAAVYKQNTGVLPKLTLYTGGSVNEEDACLLSNDDLVSDALQTNEHVTAKISAWEKTPLSQKYEETCKENNQVTNPTILNACHQSVSTGRVDLKNSGLSSLHLKTLVSSLTQQEITSILLPGNCLHDDGVATLCESLQRQMTLTCPSNSFNSTLTELDLKCSNLTQHGLRRLAQAAESGALKQLQTLDISYNRFGDSCLENLATLIKSVTSLKQLSMSRCRFTNKLFENNYLAFKAAMQGHMLLSTLDVSHNQIGSVGVELLLKSLPHSTLTDLNISGTCDAANNLLLMRHVINYLKQEGCNLQVLHLAANHLNFEMISELARELTKIQQQLPLRSLNISKNLLNSSMELKITSLLNQIPSIAEISNNPCCHKWKANIMSIKASKTGNRMTHRGQLLFA
ncbi:tonsoku-like protein [Styela clava]